MYKQEEEEIVYVISSREVITVYTGIGSVLLGTLILTLTFYLLVCCALVGLPRNKNKKRNNLR